MRVQSFGSIQIDDVTYEHDVVLDRGEVRKRKKKPSLVAKDGENDYFLRLRSK